ncbi:hypothetical protein [Streptomyces sp. CA-132043]|uniref:hypothetical protein n=1 Tax=Streptomyces sp. CA-132043 TaxID=3240048 RepID=UPI003D905188
MSTLRVDVLAYEMPCERCSFPLWWVFGLLPCYRPRGEEFTTTDFPAAVDMARNILAAPDGDTADVAAQLHDRPAWQRGRSFNPNRCGACGHHADWDVLDDVLNRVFHGGGWIYAAEGRVPVTQWRAIRGRGQGIFWPHC